MKVTLKENKLTIEVEINKPLVASKSGKTLLVASSNGNVPTTAQVDGKPIIIGFNAYVKK